MNPIFTSQADAGYSTWETCVNEHIVRAVDLRLTKKYMGEETYQQALYDEKAQHFAYIELVCNRLEEYEINRTQYANFESFYPRLIDLLAEIAAMDFEDDFFSFPFPGQLMTVWDDEEIIMIIPTAEDNANIQEQIVLYVREIHEWFSSAIGVPVLLDSVALKQDLSKHSIVAYGTIRGNLWLREHFAFLEHVIKEDQVITNKEHIGTDLRFCTAWPNPFNSKKGVSVYSAQQAKSIVGIHSLFTGATDYVVGQGTDVLQSEYYKKTDGDWQF